MQYALVKLAAVVALGAALAACSSRTTVSATGSTPAQYTHAWITVQAVWLNTDARATAGGSGWAKYALTTPVTVDLVTSTDGVFAQLIGDLKIPPTTYRQLRLIPLDNLATLSSSARSAGALYNNEADYVDATGGVHQLPLEIPNPDAGIGISATLKVPVGKFGVVGAGSGASGSTSFGVTNGSTFGTTNGSASSAPMTGTNPFGSSSTSSPTSTTGTGSSTTSATSSTGGSTGGSAPTTVTFGVALQGSTDLVPFQYGSSIACAASGATKAAPCEGMLLSAHASAYDLAAVGGIQGTLALGTLTTTTSLTHPSQRLNLTASAQTLSADGSRHVVVASAPVRADGTFVLYPLPTSTTKSVSYDVVIHGAGSVAGAAGAATGIATIIVKGVAVTNGGPDLTSAVSLGTLIPHAASGTFQVNASAAAGAALPAGATVGWYQTLAGSGELPYLIEQAALDPFTGNLDTPLYLSRDTVETGTFSASGGTITLTNATLVDPQGHLAQPGTYGVAADAVGFASSSLLAVGPPASAGTVASTQLPGLSVASGAATASITAAVSVQPGIAYDHADLLVSHDGTLFAVSSLDSVLKKTGGGSITVAGLPGGSATAPYPAGLYALAVRAWKDSDPRLQSSAAPVGTLHLQSYPTPVDLRQGSATGIQLSID